MAIQIQTFTHNVNSVGRPGPFRSTSSIFSVKIGNKAEEGAGAGIAEIFRKRKNALSPDIKRSQNCGP